MIPSTEIYTHKHKKILLTSDYCNDVFKLRPTNKFVLQEIIHAVMITTTVITILVITHTARL